MAAGGADDTCATSCPAFSLTLIMWLAAGVIFGRYLAEFAYTYVTYYAGLASAMIALVFST
jgi:membrane protein